jgi:DNA polymerase-3 subunit delta
MRETKTGQGQGVLAEIKENRFRPVYVLVGEDTGLVDEILDQLRSRLISPGLESFDLDVLTADDLRLEDLRAKLRQLPVGEHRLVVIKGLSRQGSDGAVFSDLKKNGTVELCREIALVREPIHVAATALTKKELDRVLADTGLSKYRVAVQTPGDSELASLIRGWAKAAGVTLAPDTVRLLIDIAGSDTATLRTEVEKLATCFPGSTVSADSVRELVGSSREFQLKEYVDRVLARDAIGAVRILRRLEEWPEDPVKIHIWLTTGFLGLVAAMTEGDGRSRTDRAGGRWPGVSEVNRCLQQLYNINKARMSGKREDYARLEAFTHCIACSPGSSGQSRRSGPMAGCELASDGRHYELCMRSRKKSNHG